ncbi:hypothetical protein ACQ4PT_050225 [Festuca glaucescens]
MGATAVLQPPRLPRRTAAIADLYSRTRCLSINPSCMASAAAPKQPKRPGSTCSGEPPAKRVRAASPHLAAASAIVGSKKRPCPSSGRDPKCSTLLAAASAIENKPTDSPRNHLSESTAARPKPSTGCSMRELIEKARLAKAAEGFVDRRRSEARRQLEQMVATAEFNDPFIDPADVFMSSQQLREAREAAAGAEARIVAAARQREMEALRCSVLG